MERIIVSGFRKFGDYKTNASQDVAYKMRGMKISGFEIMPAIFDASISRENRGQHLSEIADTVSAKGIITLGMASEKTGLCVERTAKNRIFNEKYVTAPFNNTPVDNRRLYPEKLSLELGMWNIPKWQEKCRQDRIPCTEISDDAGGFCCNQLMYQFCAYQVDASPKIPFIFIHIPCNKEAIADLATFTRAGKVTMEIDQVIDGLILLLANASF